MSFTASRTLAIVGGGGAEVLFGRGAGVGFTGAVDGEFVVEISSRIVTCMTAPAFAGGWRPYPVVLGPGVCVSVGGGTELLWPTLRTEKG